MKINWNGNFSIKTEVDINSKDEKSIFIIANKDGLLSLANILTDMANDEIYSGWHLHLDDSVGLEKGSVELTLAKK